jgi:hypothetical protein
MAPADALGEPKRMSANDAESQESYECPTCGLSCETARSMKAHHKRQHGKSIAATHTTEPWQDADTLRDLYHGREMTQAEIADRFGVTRPCIGKWLRRHDIQTRDPNKPGERVALSCGECETEFKVRPCREDSAQYCSASCRATAVSREMWEDRPQPDEPVDLYYGPEWEARRDEVRERDGYCCQACGRPEAGMDRELQVHHIIPFRQFDGYECANRLENLVALCVGCHTRWEGIPLRPEVGSDA